LVIYLVSSSEKTQNLLFFASQKGGVVLCSEVFYHLLKIYTKNC